MKKLIFLFFLTFSSSLFSQSIRDRLDDIENKLDDLEQQRLIEQIRRNGEESRRLWEEQQRQRQNSQSSSCQNIKNFVLVFNKGDFCQYLSLSNISKINKSVYRFYFFYPSQLLTDVPVRHYHFFQEREMNCSEKTERAVANIYLTLDDKSVREPIVGRKFLKFSESKTMNQVSQYICR